MFSQLGLVDLISAVQKTVQTKTGLRCYDSVPDNATSPFYFAEVVSKRPEKNKMMFKDVFTVFIHAIASPGASSVEIYDLIQKLEEALTTEIELPPGFDLLLQSNAGLQTIQTDETNEKHAVVAYEFTVCYGYKIK